MITVQITDDFADEIVKQSLMSIILDLDYEEDEELIKAAVKVIEYYSTPTEWEEFQKEYSFE